MPLLTDSRLSRDFSWPGLRRGERTVRDALRYEKMRGIILTRVCLSFSLPPSLPWPVLPFLYLPPLSLPLLSLSYPSLPYPSLIPLFLLTFLSPCFLTVKKERALQLVTLDPHGPNELRCNQPLSNMKEFLDAFEVKEGSKMFKIEAERVDIW